MPFSSYFSFCIVAFLAFSNLSLAQELETPEANVRMLDCSGVDAIIRKSSGVLVRGKLLKIDATGIRVETKGKEFTYKNSIVKSVRALDGDLQYNPGKETFGEFLAGLDNDLSELNIVFEQEPLVADADSSTIKKPNRFVEPAPEKSSTKGTTTTTTSDSTTSDSDSENVETTTNDTETATKPTVEMTKSPIVELTETSNATGDVKATMTDDGSNTDTSAENENSSVNNTNQNPKTTPTKLVVPNASSLQSKPLTTPTTTTTPTTGSTTAAPSSTMSANSAIEWVTQSKITMGIIVLVVVIFLFNLFR